MFCVHGGFTLGIDSVKFGEDDYYLVGAVSTTPIRNRVPQWLEDVKVVFPVHSKITAYNTLDMELRKGFESVIIYLRPFLYLQLIFLAI